MGSRSSPTLNLIAVSSVVYVLLEIGGFLGTNPWQLALALPVDQRPWTLLTSVFAHATLSHLFSNMIALAVLGLILERRTSDARFYAFFVLTGILSGLAEVSVASVVFGDRALVMGASGAIFGLLGYLVGGNRLTDRVIAGVSVSPTVQLLLFGVIALGLTFATLSPRVALIAHLSGFLIGVAAGRVHLLRPDSPSPDRPDPEPW